MGAIDKSWMTDKNLKKEVAFIPTELNSRD